MQRRWTITLLVGASLGLAGCQAPSLGGLAFWKGSGSSAAPDVGKQRFDGLSQQLASDDFRPSGQTRPGTTPLGAARTSEDGVLMASWKKTTAAVTGAVAAKPKPNVPEDDPLRLDKVPKKIGPEVYIGAARLLENQGKTGEAEQKYLDALKASPSDLTALVGLARLYDRDGQSRKAVEVYQRALKDHPSSSLVSNDLGLCYLRQKQLENSILAFRQAVDLQPDNTKYRNNLAAALVDDGRDEDALRELRAAGPPAVAHFNLAYLLQERGRKADAVQHLQQAVSLDASLTPAQEMLAQLVGQSSAQPAAARQEIAPPAGTHIVTRPIATVPATSAYAAGAADQPVYTSAPQIAAPASPGSSKFHIADDSSPAAGATARRTDWSGSTGTTPEQGDQRDGGGELKLLPPTE